MANLLDRKLRKSARMKRYYLANKERIRAKNKAYAETHRKEALEYAKEYRSKNKHKIQVVTKQWYWNNREHRLQVSRQWQQANKGKVNSIEAKRRATKLKATPKWADLRAIEEFYKNCPEGFHVDHIVPLQGKTVSGLHVIENLQYLPASENMSKGNKYESIRYD